MGDCAGNNPLSTAEIFGGSQQSQLNVLDSPAVGKTQLGSYSGWDPTQPLDLGDSLLSSLRLRPSAISNQTSINTSRQSSSDVGLLKTFQSSLPTQSNFGELNKAQKASNNTNQLLCQHVAEATTSMVGMIGS
ncbi:hypothetical protein DFH28DRAFT_1105380 [Melampsora americana]|nr:hypothetical protein DFH28DRAFT_1105380 [Melampsora americana]